MSGFCCKTTWIMENIMETTIVYWGNIGIMENQMETIRVLGIASNLLRLRTVTPKP